MNFKKHYILHCYIEWGIGIKTIDCIRSTKLVKYIKFNEKFTKDDKILYRNYQICLNFLQKTPTITLKVIKIFKIKCKIDQNWRTNYLNNLKETKKHGEMPVKLVSK